MIKKFLFLFIAFFIFCQPATFAEENNQNTNIKPLKIEQIDKNYNYGNFEKTFSAEKNYSKSDFPEILDKKQDKKEPTIMDIFSSLIFVILLICLTGWVYMKFKKINPEQLLSGKFNKLSENTFKIISSLQLGTGKAIYLIEINDQQLIVGTTATNVNLLAKIDKQNKKSEIPQETIEKLLHKEDEKFKKLDE